MRAKLGITVVIAFVILPIQAGRSAPTTVYDNTAVCTSGAGAPNGFWPFDVFTANERMGDEISLAGTDRYVTEFDLMLRSSGATTLSHLGFALYDLGPDGFPNNQLWATDLTDVHVEGNTTVPINVPSIEVPDRLVWVAWADSNAAGLATCKDPAVGFSPVFTFPDGTVYDYYWDLDTPSGSWMPLQFPGDDPVADFGAKVLAVPEPASILIVVAGLFLTAARKRKTNRCSL